VPSERNQCPAAARRGPGRLQHKLSGRIALLSSVGILATSLVECALYLSALEVGRSGDTTPLVAATTVINGLQHVYLIVLCCSRGFDGGILVGLSRSQRFRSAHRAERGRRCKSSEWTQTVVISAS